LQLDHNFQKESTQPSEQLTAISPQNPSTPGVKLKSNKRRAASNC
jgi:hypothetical protein